MAAQHQRNFGRGNLDEYTQEKILGKGAYGVAYAVKHLKSGAREVMKIIDLS